MYFVAKRNKKRVISKFTKFEIILGKKSKNEEQKKAIRVAEFKLTSDEHLIFDLLATFIFYLIRKSFSSETENETVS